MRGSLHIFCRLIMLFALCSATIAVAEIARPVLALAHNAGRATLEGYAELLVDEGGQLTIADVASAQSGSRFAPIANIRESYGYSRAPHWLRFTVRQEDAKAREWLLEVEHAYLDDVRLYTPDESGGFRMRRTGDRVPFGARDLDYHNFVFRMPLAGTAPKTFYLRLQTEGNLSFPLTIWSPRHFAEEKLKGEALLGAYYGIVATVILYNLFLYFSMRERIYLFYILHAAALSLFLFATNGLAFQYLWPDSPWFANYAHQFFTCVTLICGGIFFYLFLDLGSQFPRLARLFKAVVIPPAIMIIGAAVLRYDISAKIIMGITLANLFIWLGSGLWLTWQGSRPARLFVLIFFVEIVGACFTVFNRIGLISTSIISEHLLQIGSVIEVVFFSMALANRINVLRRDKDLAQAAALESREAALAAAKESESVLEQRVVERTQQFSQINQRLQQEIGVRRQAEELLRESEQRMRHMAHHDSLTGLPNRTLIIDRLDQALAHARRNVLMASAMMVDLDHFKEINDSLGHAVGDRVLMEIGQRLTTCLRQSDSVGRMSGDEFIIVLEALESAKDAALVAEKILAALDEPIFIDGKKLAIGCSIGIGIFPADAIESLALLKSADMAMYRAKLSGRNRYIVHSEAA